MPEPVAVFLDGANLYRAFRMAFGSARYSPLNLASDLAGGRQLVRTTFYIAAVPQQMGAQLYADQQRFLNNLKQQQGLTVWTGRMAQTAGRWYEKGVDVKIATDMVAMAYAGDYDAAILVSGDGDLAPAIREVRRLGRVVENAMPRIRRSWHLLQESSKFVKIDHAIKPRSIEAVGEGLEVGRRRLVFQGGVEALGELSEAAPAAGDVAFCEAEVRCAPEKVGLDYDQGRVELTKQVLALVEVSRERSEGAHGV